MPAKKLNRFHRSPLRTKVARHILKLYDNRYANATVFATLEAGNKSIKPSNSLTRSFLPLYERASDDLTESFAGHSAP
jgi:hypothetical protein